MIVSAIADPSLFGPANVIDRSTVNGLVAFLRGIIQNGVILCDPDRQMLRDALAEAAELERQPGGTKKGQRLRLLLEEIYSKHKKFVVCCSRTAWLTRQPASVVDRITFLHSELAADAIVAATVNVARIRKAISEPLEILGPGDVMMSRYEQTRLRVSELPRPLDELTPNDLEEFVGRCLKYAPLIRFFDYRMVASAGRASKFCAGIGYIIAIWRRWCVVGDTASRGVEMYTVGNTHTESGYLDAADANVRLRDSIVVPLMAGAACAVSGFVKDDCDRIFHTRGFEARRRAYTIDPGFDALGDCGPVRRCLLKRELAAEAQFEECRSLPSV